MNGEWQWMHLLLSYISSVSQAPYSMLPFLYCGKLSYFFYYTFEGFSTYRKCEVLYAYIQSFGIPF